MRYGYLLIPFASVLVLVNPLTIYLGHGYHQNLAYGSYSIWEAYSELLARSHGGGYRGLDRFQGHQNLGFRLLSARSAVMRVSELSRRFRRSLIVSAI